jgi:hypothetical protein
MQPPSGMPRMRVEVAALSALLFTITSRFALADDAPPEPKDRGTAVALSAGGTMASATLLVVGVETKNGALAAAGLISSLVTPSAGEIYAGRVVTPGLVLRLVSAGAAVAGLEEAFKCFLASSPCQHDPGLAAGLIVAGGIGYASGILYDIATAGRAVDDYNQRMHVRVTPTVIPTAASGPAVGLGIGGSF